MREDRVKHLVVVIVDYILHTVDIGCFASILGCTHVLPYLQTNEYRRGS